MNYLDFDLDKDRKEFYEKTNFERNETNDELAKVIHETVENTVAEKAVAKVDDFKDIVAEIKETVKAKLVKTFESKPDLGKAYNDYHELMEIFR